ncbi:MAG TPA: histone deacetylase family protein [Candidatus Limnocylindrales bacterium]|nr:histone deacetylase family protein [Candidatus Limnocylindrales bacterium]
MRYVYSPLHMGHDIRTQTVMGVQVEANEVRERAEVIRETLDGDGGFEAVATVEHGGAPITAVHDPGLIRFLEDAWDDAVAQGHPYDFLAPETIPNRAMTEGMSGRHGTEARRPDGRAGYWALDTSTYIVPGTYAAARAAVDVALTTADLVLAGERAAYGLCRPPGHHAARSMYGGFCYFNNAAIAAEAVARETGEHVSILDVDFHHGNGTEQIFWRRGDVLYVSLHAHPGRQYPYALGWEDETGEGDGTGANLNIPLPLRTTDDQYLAALDRGLARVAEEPGDVVVVSLGFDTYGKDPIGDFALTTPVYHECGQRVAALGKRLVILQEGGYHVGDLGENARAWLRGAEGRAYQESRILPSAE